MSQTECGSIREVLPAFVGNRATEEDVSQVEAHLAECAECRAELELVQVIYASRAVAPDGLADRVMGAVGRDGRPGERPWWGISAAAVAALALGIGITSQTGGPTPITVPDYAYESEEGVLWLSDDGLLAGAPTVEDLSDEALLELLDELAMDLSGGAA